MVPKRFGDFSEYREVTGPPPGEVMVHMGHRGEEEAGHGRWRAPSQRSPNWTRGRVRPPFPYPSTPLSPFPLSVGRKGGAD